MNYFTLAEIFFILIPGVLGAIVYGSIGCRLVYKDIDLNAYYVEILILISLAILSIAGSVLFLCFKFPYFSYLSEPALLAISSVIAYQMWKE